MHWGIKPEAMIGHSLGEYVAACLAGVFTLEEALPLIAMRGRLVAEMPSGHMLAVRLPEAEVLPLLNGQLSLAAVNSSSQCVVAGDEAAMATLQQLLNERSVACSRLNTSHAMHSPAMDPILASLTQHFERITLRPPSIRYVSNVTGTWIEPAEACSPAYWAKHIRQTVRFAQGVEQLTERTGRRAARSWPRSNALHARAADGSRTLARDVHLATTRSQRSGRKRVCDSDTGFVVDAGRVCRLVQFSRLRKSVSAFHYLHIPSNAKVIGFRRQWRARKRLSQKYHSPSQKRAKVLPNRNRRHLCLSNSPRSYKISTA